MKIIKGDLILDKDIVTFDEDIKVKGNIISKDYCRNLIVKGDINAWDIDVKNINAWDINAENIDAWNIDAWNIDVKNINAWDINAENINAENINAAMDINYYAVCFAYKNIKCNSIKGRRNNCKHFVLDGKIIIKKEIGQICPQCDVGINSCRCEDLREKKGMKKDYSEEMTEEEINKLELMAPDELEME